MIHFRTSTSSNFLKRVSRTYQPKGGFVHFLLQSVFYGFPKIFQRKHFSKTALLSLIKYTGLSVKFFLGNNWVCWKIFLEIHYKVFISRPYNLLKAFDWLWSRGTGEKENLLFFVLERFPKLRYLIEYLGFSSDNILKLLAPLLASKFESTAHYLSNSF